VYAVPAHTPPLHASFFVQAWPSSQELPSSLVDHSVWLVLEMQTWQVFDGLLWPSLQQAPPMRHQPALIG
jgi:hypothetical protein